ncbi:epoxide hydrolase family protein [Mammaliicoccus sciuri]|uniref:epoxide hydrolase family protein n=1 Tax=Mammaliicoccus sciuri TaxID=1296 RepID=UPI0034DD418C
MNKNKLAEYKIQIPKAVVDDLYKRLDNTRFPDEDIDSLCSTDITLQQINKWIKYWRYEYDMNNISKKFHSHELYLSTIEGVDIVFTHVSSNSRNSPFLLMIHGWPDTPLSYFDMITTLSDDFNLIIPTIPGFGIPGPVQKMNTKRAAEIFLKLMDHLEIRKYFIHGVDFGASIARTMGVLKPSVIKGIHVTMLQHANAYNINQINQKNPYELESLKASERYINELNGYSTIQSTKPQDIAYSLSDSPVGLLAWIGSQFISWGDPNKMIESEKIIDTVMVYWVYNTIGSSARYYRLGREDWYNEVLYNHVPTSVTVMPYDIGKPIKRFAQKTDNISHWTYAKKGGHFASYDEPKFLASEIIKMK